MPASPASVRSLQARNAAAKRWNSADQDAVGRQYAEHRLAAHIKTIVDGAPKLSPEQVDRLTLLLRGGDPA